MGAYWIHMRPKCLYMRLIIQLAMCICMYKSIYIYVYIIFIYKYFHANASLHSFSRLVFEFLESSLVW